MSQLNPNKETVRRICSIFKCNLCWLMNNGKELFLLVEIDSASLQPFKNELESWSGCIFNVHNFDSEQDIIKTIKTSGEKLLPINQEVAMQDIEMRRKENIHNK